MNTSMVMAIEDVEIEKQVEFNRDYVNLLKKGREFLLSVSAASKIVCEVGTSRTIYTVSEEFACDITYFMKTFMKCVNTAKRIDNLLVPMSKISNIKLLDQYFDHLKEEIIYNQDVIVEIYDCIRLLIPYITGNVLFFAENSVRIGEISIKCGDIVNKQKELMQAITRVEFNRFYLEKTT